ncbi:MAG: alkaline phosphatase family protein [Candidatus Hydrogenedentota bacterium]|nr:MAG: alkaline phosphatase family protein [Candidatus Hydrogenedentota bacterium]
MKPIWNHFRLPILFGGFYLFLSSILRVVLMAKFVSWKGLTPYYAVVVLFTGLRFDLFISLCLSIPYFFVATLCSGRRKPPWILRWSVYGTLFPAIYFLIFLCPLEYFFFEEFESRLNYIAFEYLIYPTEVFTNIWQSYPVVPVCLAVLIMTVLVFWFFRRSFLASCRVPLSLASRLGVLTAMILLTALFGKTLQLEDIEKTPNRVANETASNGIYSFFSYAATARFDYPSFYLTIPKEEAVRRVRSLIAAPDTAYVSNSGNPIDRWVKTGRPRHDYNVVMIVDESFGSTFIGRLGGTGNLTPHFQALTKDGILFDHWHPTGNRTARALEAALASIPPIPTEAILKRDHSNRVYTLARLLKKRGYINTFVYGGRGIFDGMRSFALKNGYDRFIEQKDFANPSFVTAWGVADEDIFRKAVEVCDSIAESGRPFFTTILTVSNHKPFTYPDGRIPEPSADRLQNHAVKYADWALGMFFAKMKKRDYYSRTLFVFFGDHGARVYGSQAFPLRSYRVPFLMLLPGKEGAGTVRSVIGSHMDIAPTIMGVLGGTYRSTFFGNDMLSISQDSGFAPMQHNHDLILLRADNHVGMVSARKRYRTFRYDTQTYILDPLPHPDSDLVRTTAALFQLADHLYYTDALFPGGNAGKTSHAASYTENGNGLLMEKVREIMDRLAISLFHGQTGLSPRQNLVSSRARKNPVEKSKLLIESRRWWIRLSRGNEK